MRANTDTGREVYKALVYWAAHLRSVGQEVPPGYAELSRSLIDAANHDPEWLTPSKAPERAGVSTRTIRRWRQAGLPSTTVGRAIPETVPTEMQPTGCVPRITLATVEPDTALPDAWWADAHRPRAG
jgi:hypothetical protein